jgi:hypothetical protein
VAAGAGIDGADQVLVAASAGNGLYREEEKGGMFVSQDGGKTFTKVRTPACKPHQRMQPLQQLSTGLLLPLQQCAHQAV